MNSVSGRSDANETDRMQDKTTRLIAGLLLVSGVLHLGLWCLSGQAWEGALSWRKPALFGISGGMTVWSLGWVMTHLKPAASDKFWSRVMAWSLLCEVGLITLQCWRGVASHFNDATTLDRFIERTMLTLILLVTGIIAWLSVRSLRPLNSSPTMALAIRAGMLLLLLSCLLGMATTALGHWNLSHGRPHELWGRAGVLKFPHGVALHAIQLLPLCAWLFAVVRLPRSYMVMQGLIAAQVCFLLLAVWQTWQGRARFDVDGVGVVLGGSAMLCIVVPLLFVSKFFLSDRTKNVADTI